MSERDAEPDREDEPRVERKARAGSSWSVPSPADYDMSFVPVFAIVYAVIVIGAIAFAVGIVAWVYTFIGPYLATAVAGAFGFGYAYTLLRIIDAVTA